MTFANGLVALVAVVILLLATRARAVDLTVCGLPIASVMQFGPVSVNASVADLFLPFALLAMLMQPRHTDLPEHERVRKSNRWLLYGAAASVAMLLGLFIRVMENEPTNLGYGLAAVVKLWTGYTYLAVFAVYGIRAFEPGGDRMLKLWVRVSSIAALAGIGGIALWTRGIVTPFVYAYRAKGLFDDPNLFASYLLLGISLTFVANARGLLKHPNLTVGVQTVALVLTGSRAAIPALAAGVLAAFLMGRGSIVLRRVVPWMGLLAAGFALAAWRLPSLLQLDALSRVTTASSTVESDGRLTLWRIAGEMWLDHPIFGVGLGQYIPEAGNYIPGGLVNIPHSSHLSLLAETGAVGYALVMGLPLAILFRTARLARRTSDPTPTWMLVGIAGSLAMAWTLNLENSRMLWSFLGICLGYCVAAARGSLGGEADGAEESLDAQHFMTSRRHDPDLALNRQGLDQARWSRAQRCGWSSWPIAAMS